MYNNTYYPNYGNIPQQPQQNYQRNNYSPDERIWVQNETSAEAYLLAPNGFARLWDSSCNRFYEKRADATGRPLPMDIYEYTKILPQNEVPEPIVSKTSIDEINERIEQITSRIDALERSKKGVVKNAKQSDADDTSI